MLSIKRIKFRVGQVEINFSVFEIGNKFPVYFVEDEKFIDINEIIS